MYARVLFQRIEVGIIGKMLQHDNGNVHLVLLQLERLLGECHRVFFLDMDILEIRDHTQDGHPADLLQHPAPFLKQAHIPTELIDDDTLDKGFVFWCLQGDTAIDRSEHPSPINIAH